MKMKEKDDQMKMKKEDKDRMTWLQVLCGGEEYESESGVHMCSRIFIFVYLYLIYCIYFLFFN